MNKGDILYGRKNTDAVHPIVYLRRRDENFFIGAMLTKSGNYTNNILMAEKHFKKIDLNGKKYEFRFKNTHFVRAELIKKEEWRPFKKVGELTKEGIKFIESKISNKNPEFWEDCSDTKNINEI